jgi:hypothetical protein
MDFRTLCHLARTRTSTLFTHVRIQSVTKHLRRDKTKVHKLGGKLGKERWRGQHAAFCTPSGRGLRVRVEMMGPGIYDNAGKTQSVLLMITFMISPHTRGTMRGRRSGAGRTVTVWPAPHQDQPLHGLLQPRVDARVRPTPALQAALQLRRCLP